MPVELIVDGERYDVEKFDHPGDGIEYIYLRNYHRHDVTEAVLKSHNDVKYQYDILAKAREDGEYQGIVYLGKVEKKSETDVEKKAETDDVNKEIN